MLGEMPLCTLANCCRSRKEPNATVGHHPINVEQENLDTSCSLLCGNRQSSVSHISILLVTLRKQVATVANAVSEIGDNSYMPLRPQEDDETISDETKVAPEPRPDEYYFDGPFMVFTEEYHLRRGWCCKSGCRHCPYGFKQSETPLVSD
jgi:hypothetical protein